MSADPLPLAEAAARLWGKPGRPRRESTPEEQAKREEGRRRDREARLAAITPRLLDVDQAAHYYGDVSPWTIRDLHAAKKLPAVRLDLGDKRAPLRRLLFDVKDLDRLSEQSKETGA